MDKEIRIRDEFIRLGQALKLAGISQTGIEAKIMITSGEVRVNGIPAAPQALLLLGNAGCLSRWV